MRDDDSGIRQYITIFYFRLGAIQSQSGCVRTGGNQTYWTALPWPFSSAGVGRVLSWNTSPWRSRMAVTWFCVLISSDCPYFRLFVRLSDNNIFTITLIYGKRLKLSKARPINTRWFSSIQTCNNSCIA